MWFINVMRELKGLKHSEICYRRPPLWETELLHVLETTLMDDRTGTGDHSYGRPPTCSSKSALPLNKPTRYGRPHVLKDHCPVLYPLTAKLFNLKFHPRE